MGNFRATVGVFILSLLGAIALLEFSGFTEEVGVSSFEALAAIPLEIAVPILVVVAVLAIWNPDTGSSPRRR